MQPHATIESIKQKDKMLLAMLKPEFGSQLVFPSNDMTKASLSLSTLSTQANERRALLSHSGMPLKPPESKASEGYPSGGTSWSCYSRSWPRCLVEGSLAG